MLREFLRGRQGEFSKGGVGRCGPGHRACGWDPEDADKSLNRAEGAAVRSGRLNGGTGVAVVSENIQGGAAEVSAAAAYSLNVTAELAETPANSPGMTVRGNCGPGTYPGGAAGLVAAPANNRPGRAAGFAVAPAYNRPGRTVVLLRLWPAA